MPVTGADRQERQTGKADKAPKSQAGVPKECVKHNAPPLSAPFTLMSFAPSRRKINQLLTSGSAELEHVVGVERWAAETEIVNPIDKARVI